MEAAPLGDILDYISANYLPYFVVIFRFLTSTMYRLPGVFLLLFFHLYVFMRRVQLMRKLTLCMGPPFPNVLFIGSSFHF